MRSNAVISTKDKKVKRNDNAERENKFKRTKYDKLNSALFRAALQLNSLRSVAGM